MLDDITTHPATPDRWADIETVFSGRGDPGKCWCAYWVLANKDFKAGWGPGNKVVLKERVEAGPPPGVIAYVEGLPAGWAGIGPRATFDRLRRSRSIAPVDDRPVWSLNCLVVHRDFRRRGLMRPLIRGAVEFALSQGAPAVEAYPIDSEAKPTVWDLFLGTIAAYQDEGFVEVARHVPRRPIMRYWPDGA